MEAPPKDRNDDTPDALSNEGTQCTTTPTSHDDTVAPAPPTRMKIHPVLKLPPKRVHIVSTYDDAARVAEKILARGTVCIGFDTETTVRRQERKGKPSIMQLYVPSRSSSLKSEDNGSAASVSSDETTVVDSRFDGDVYIIRIYAFAHGAWPTGKPYENRLPKPFKRLLESIDVIKCGPAILDDASSLAAYGVEMRGLLDTQVLARARGGGSMPLSLEGLASHFGLPLGNKNLIKSGPIARVDWDSDSLRDWQVEYLAWDAFLSFAVTAHLIGLLPLLSPPVSTSTL